jgi:DNA polymerase I-like protein with 3'-5' exonuclease and polymerase domains
MGARQLLWVHDEAVLDAPDENAEEAKLQVVKHMTAAGKYTKILKYQPPFDLVVSAKIADNWLAAK